MKKKLLTLAVILGIVMGGLYLLNKDSEPATRATTNSQPTSSTENQQKPANNGFDKNKHSTSEVTSIWVVVNKQRPLKPETYAPNDLISVGNNQKMRKEPAGELAKLVAAAKSEGLVIQPMSGYRSYDTQAIVYDSEVRTNGQTVADSQSARPGTSEHQTGLGIDVGGGGCGIEDCFGNTAEGKWVAANAYKYGFIIRYTDGKQAITGYRAEPWHLRYVGMELATEMRKQNILT